MGIVYPNASSGVGSNALTFQPKNYGAKGDGQVVKDGAMTATESILTCATSKPFKPTDVGKYVTVNNANTEAFKGVKSEKVKTEGEGATKSTKRQFLPLCAKIAKYISPEQVELDTVCQNTTAGSLVLWASDDNEALEKCIEASFTQALLSRTSRVKVLLEDVIYGTAGTLKTANKCNSQIQLPIVPGEKAKVVWEIGNGSESSALPIWYQEVPQQAGPVIYSFGPAEVAGGKLAESTAQPAYSAANGRPAIISGPTLERAPLVKEINNVCIVVNGLTMSGPCNSTLTQLELNQCAEATVDQFGSYALGVPNTESEGAEYQGGPNEYIPAWAGYSEAKGFIKEGTNFFRPAVALAMPAKGNNDSSYVGRHACQGHTCAIEVGEHGLHNYLKSIYCVMGMSFTKWLGSGGKSHSSIVNYMSVEGCVWGIYGVAPFTNGEVNITVLNYDSENQGGRWGRTADVFDSLNKLYGVLYINDVAPPPVITGAKNLNVYSLSVPPGKTALATSEAEYEAGVVNPIYRNIAITIENAETVEVDESLQLIPAEGKPVTLIWPSNKKIKIKKVVGKAIATKTTVLA